MNNYQIYNASSEKMNQVKNGSVNLILAGPPYNIGTVYSTNNDLTSHSQFHGLLARVFAECARVLNDKGRLIVECADTLCINGTYTSLGGLIQKTLTSLGLKLVARHISFTLTERGIELPEHGWQEDFTTTEGAHSNCHQILVFQKSGDFNEEAGNILYYNYPANEEGHPCPYSPKIIDFVLDHYSKAGDVVLDPFMGTGRLGREAVKRGGAFIGYELEKEFYDTAMRALENLDKPQP